MDGLAGGYVTVCVRTGMEPSKLGRTRGTLMLQCSTPRRKIPRPTPPPTPATGPAAPPPPRRNPPPHGLDPPPTGTTAPPEINVLTHIPKDAAPVKHHVPNNTGENLLDRLLSRAQ